MPSGHLESIVSFLRGIGVTVRANPLDPGTFLPGVRVQAGELLYDPDRLLHPGDLLHEAGHLALLPASERCRIDGDFGGDGGNEMAAIAWSYAAAIAIGLPLEILFHEDGYRGAAKSLRENFSQGRYIGVPILVWRGLTGTPQPGSVSPPGASPFPVMRQWLCD